MLSASRTADDAEWPAGVEREPHQRDVVERVPEFARGDCEIQPPEVGPVEEVQRAGRRQRNAGLELARDIENRI